MSLPYQGARAIRLALHAVSHAGVWPVRVRLGLEPVLDRAVRFGYAGVMLVARRPHASVPDLPADARRALRGAIRDRGLELAAPAGDTDFCAGHDRPDVPLREMQILYVAEPARLAHDLGGGLIRSFTGFGKPGVAYDTTWGWRVEAIRECARRAADYEVVVGVQNHHDVAAHYQSLADLLRDAAYEMCSSLEGGGSEENLDRCAQRFVSWMVTKHAPQPDALWELMKFLQTPEYTDIQARLGGAQHARISQQDRFVEVMKKAHPEIADKYVQAFGHAVKNTYARPQAVFVAKDDDAWKIVNDAWSASLVRNEQPVPDVLRDAARRIDALLAGS